MAVAPTTETAEKAPPSPEHKMRMRIGRSLGRGVWLTGYKVENPTATKEERQAAWHEARKDFTKVGMRALKSLEKNGFEVVPKADS